jgi:4-amino-4-deoxy-L-arabinose transferase-like glycosyltransferase
MRPRARECPSVGRWLLVGLVLGGASLVVAPTVVLLPVLVLLAGWEAASVRARVRQVAALVAGLLLVTAPVVLHNYRLAQLLVARGEQARALEQLTAAEQANPLNAEAFFQHATLLWQSGQTNEARVLLARAVQFNPDYQKIFWQERAKAP